MRFWIPASASPDADLSDITVLIPARNEAEVIGTTLGSLKTQGNDLAIIVVDDRSTDGTATVAKTLGVQNLRLLSGEPLPADWSGKLWALEQGFRHVNTPLTLLIDADIELRPGIVGGLRQKLKENHLHFISLMAQLRMASFWERLLMPAFVYFFKMLYPFRLSNSSFTRVAAAAGGCILLETRLIEEIGGFEAIRQELIDDCALARRVKSLGYRTWMGLTHSVHSLRSYENLAGIWNMVTRTAFCQLRYSAMLLGGITADHDNGILVTSCGIVLSGGQCKDPFRRCLGGTHRELSANPEVLSPIERMGLGSASDCYSLSCHDLVVGNSVLDWSRITLERKVLHKKQKGLIPR